MRWSGTKIARNLVTRLIIHTLWSSFVLNSELDHSIEWWAKSFQRISNRHKIDRSYWFGWHTIVACACVCPCLRPVSLFDTPCSSERAKVCPAMFRNARNKVPMREMNTQMWLKIRLGIVINWAFDKHCNTIRKSRPIEPMNVYCKRNCVWAPSSANIRRQTLLTPFSGGRGKDPDGLRTRHALA